MGNQWDRYIEREERRNADRDAFEREQVRVYDRAMRRQQMSENEKKTASDQAGEQVSNGGQPKPPSLTPEQVEAQRTLSAEVRRNKEHRQAHLDELLKAEQGD